METTKITVQSAIHADVAKVWEYYNQPEHITRWNFADPLWHCPSATNELRVGARYVARMEAKDGSFGFDFSATYNEVVEHEKIVYTLDDGRDVEITFDSEEGITLVIVTFDAENQNSVEVQKQGWQAILDNFKKYTEQ
ncbi:MAG TPA: SRPBCC family protein [Fermentimonas sp.]|nr:SRPBCC family protein [Fermentimonas sp.]